MRLLKCRDDGEFCLTEDLHDDDIPQYAILSHTWGADEIAFRDLIDGTVKSKASYDKIRFCGEQARRNGLQYFWVDTCCIDKSNSTELQEAINSMFCWYRDAVKCYVYLSDVATTKWKTNNQSSKLLWEPAFRVSKWFTRGWTLQELIAPSSVDFFSREGKWLGDKQSLEQEIHEITRIPIDAVRGKDLSYFSVSERISWAGNRETTRKEDMAYSLMGIFNVHMSLIYGEGKENALRRLHNKVDRHSKSETMSSVDIDNLYTQGRFCSISTVLSHF
jgi:hypothetical protein